MEKCEEYVSKDIFDVFTFRVKTFPRETIPRD